MIDRIKFYDYDDFLNRADEILVYFEVVSLLPYFSLRKYKNYIYGMRMTTKRKDLIWEYLMGDIEKEILYEQK